MEIIKDISNSFGTLSPFLTFIVIITIVVLYFLKDTINDGLKVLMLKKKKSQIVNLKKHDFFIVLESVRSKIHEIVFITHGEEDPSKTYLLQILIDIKIDKTRELFFLFLENEHLKSYSGQELKFEIDSDVVFTALTLMYINEKVIKKIINNIANFSRDAFIIQELIK